MSSSSVRGRREGQEDRHIDVYSEQVFINGFLMAVFDGHCGDQVSELAVQALVPEFIAARQSHPNNIKKALQQVVAKLVELAKDKKAGSTVSIVFVPRSMRSAYVAILGDSPIVIVGKWRVFFGELHNTYNNREVAAALAQGMPFDGQYLVARSGRGLAVTRAIGDNDFPLLNRTPVIRQVMLGASSSILVGTDGLIEGDQRAELKKIAARLKEGASAKDLVEEAAKRGSRDNITAIVWRP
jgi:serine/threonine protein phosphatase PrpC